MTFCLGMKVQEGLVGIADTRITSGSEVITARKLFTHQEDGSALFFMTSGLRSLRDKALTYFEECLADRNEPFDRLYKAVNCYAEQLRRVAEEDKRAIDESGMTFDLNTLMGGQFERDREPRLYLIYPQGNWVEVEKDSPYSIIGSRGYGKPILDRTLNYDDSMEFALKIGCLAFDSTRISAANVDFPIDVVLYRKDTYELVECRYTKDELREMTSWWQERLRQSIKELPSGWTARAFAASPTPRDDPEFLR